MLFGQYRTDGRFAGQMNALTRAGKSTAFLGTGIVIATIVLLCAYLNSMITDAPVVDDGWQNLQSAYNIKKWGVFSHGISSEQPSPDNYREPLPPAVTAAFMYVLGDARMCLYGDCNNGFVYRTIKKINIAWSLIVLCFSALLTYRLTGSKTAAVVVVLLIHLTFLSNPAYVDSLYTEIPASACMLAAAWCLMTCFRNPSPRVYLLTGIAIGLLPLVKAMFLYMLVPVAAVVLLRCAVLARKTHAGTSLLCCVLLITGLLLTTGPWLLRNLHHFGSLQISSRGGLALYTRALINQIDAYEFRAAFHYWGPGAYRRLVRNTALDINDRDYERNGRAVRLNDSDGSSFFQDDVAAQNRGRPEDARSFYRIARAQRVRASMDARQSGQHHERHAADNYLRDEALAMITQHPLRHMLATIPLAWRGMWCFYGGGVFTLICAAAYGSFVFMSVYGVARQRWDILALIAVPFFLLLFNAFLSNNLPRFNAPAIPFMVISFVAALQAMLRRMTTDVKNQDYTQGKLICARPGW
jgi:hypothetical protein